MSVAPAQDAALLDALARQRDALRLAEPPTAAARRAHLATLRELVHERREVFAEAISEDFGHRCRSETLLFEVQAVLSHARHMAKHLGKWMRSERKPVEWPFKPAAARIEYSPAGIVGIVSPWNYPLALSLIPMATALAAGNRIMLKPSEKTPRTSALLADMLHEGYGEQHVRVVTGGIDVGVAFAHLPFDHLLFTGSSAVGKEIMHAAAENLVPVTLELGGKSPVLVDESAHLEYAARRIAYGKLANAGQTCMAPDYALVPRNLIDDFVESLTRAVDELYPQLRSNLDYTAIANDEQLVRLEALVDDARARGARVIRLGDHGRQTHRRTFNPVLLLEVDETMRVMQEEIFGPILPILPYAKTEDAIELVNRRPPALTLYLFGRRSNVLKRIIARIPSGNVACNETIMHYAQSALPFGGVGESGMGVYHGHEGFKRLSHARSVFAQRRPNLVPWVYPPYSNRSNRLLKLILRP